jgi:lipopolysaccharide biosynthesis glycosyltransferase
MTKGILYYVWGNYNKTDLNKSIESARKFGYHTKVVHDYYKGKGLQRYQKRIGIYDSSPFDLTLHLDTDTIIKGNLDYGFNMAKKYGLACCIAPASSSYIATPNTIQDIMNEDLPQYNCGVLFFSKKAKKVFRRWERLLVEHPLSKDNDQPYFAQAVSENLNPYILPKTWNFRPHVRYESKAYHGELKILHSNR